MDIALMNEKVTFQKNTVITDSIGKHKNGWEDFYSCFATIGGEGTANVESETAGKQCLQQHVVGNQIYDQRNLQHHQEGI